MNALRKKAYSAWKNAIYRCKYCPKFQLKGITVCPSWVKSFDQFILDLGYPPSRGHVLARIRYDQGFSPDNCHWSIDHYSKEEIKIIALNSHRHASIYEASTRVAVSKSTLYYRIRRQGFQQDRPIDHPDIIRPPDHSGGRPSKRYWHRDHFMTIAEIAQMHGIRVDILYYHKRKGRTIEQALLQIKYA